MLDIERLIRYPAQDPKWVMKIAVGGILSIIPIVNFFSIGYILETMHRGCLGRNELPDWDNWGDLFVKGFVVSAVSLIYSLVPILLIVAGLQRFINMQNSYERIHSLGTILSAFILATLLLTVVSFILPMIFAQCIAQDDLKGAFELTEACQRLNNVFGEYMVAHALYFGLISILLIIVIIPVIGLLFFLFGTFYISVVFFNLFGMLYQKSGSSDPAADLNIPA